MKDAKGALHEKKYYKTVKEYKNNKKSNILRVYTEAPVWKTNFYFLLFYNPLAAPKQNSLVNAVYYTEKEAIYTARLTELNRANKQGKL